MTDKKEDSEPKKSSWGFLDVITSRIGKIAALVTTVGLLLGGVAHFFDLWSKLFPVHEPRLPDCLKLHMADDGEKTVPVSKWDSMNLTFNGLNDCQKDLLVHVAFRSSDNDRILIESPYSECTGQANPDCWEVARLSPGHVEWQLTPPRLTILKDPPFGDPVKIDINWRVYNANTKAFLYAEKTEMQLADDRAGP